MNIGDKCNACGLTCLIDENGDTTPGERGVEPCLGPMQGVEIESARCGNGGEGFFMLRTGDSRQTVTVKFQLIAVEVDGDSPSVQIRPSAPIYSGIADADFNHLVLEDSVQVTDRSYTVKPHEDGTFSVFTQIRPMTPDGQWAVPGILEWVTLAENLTEQELMDQYAIRGNLVVQALELTKIQQREEKSDARYTRMDEYSLVQLLNGEVLDENRQWVAAGRGNTSPRPTPSGEDELAAMEHRLEHLQTSDDPDLGDFDALIRRFEKFKKAYLPAPELRDRVKVFGKALMLTYMETAEEKRSKRKENREY